MSDIQLVNTEHPVVISRSSITPTPEQVQAIVRGMIARGSNLSWDDGVIQGQQDAPPPVPPPGGGLYSVVTLIGDSSPKVASSRRSYRAVSDDPTTLEVDVQRDTYDTFDVQWIRGEEALLAAKQTRLWLRTTVGQLWARDQDMGVADQDRVSIEVMRVGQVRNLHHIWRSRWQPRAGFDLRVRYQEHIIARLPRVLKVDIVLQVSVDTGNAEPHTIRIDASEIAKARNSV